MFFSRLENTDKDANLAYHKKIIIIVERFFSGTDMTDSESTFRIRKSFLLPMGLVVLLAVILLASTLYLELPTGKVIILVILLIPTVALFIESLTRTISLTETTITIHKLLRTKTLNFADLTAVDTIRVRKRVFISLSSDTDFAIISNSYDDFGSLINQILERCSATVYGDDTRQMAKAPPRKSGDVFSAWLAAAVLLLIIIVQFRGAM